jgi:DNA (cytosine-5)-methyltransferase 1
MLTHGSLFTGIAGFDLGFERAGIRTVFQIEIDPFCRKVLERHWPNVQRFSDIRGCGRHNLPRVDVLSGGFPCQDISYAGLGAGIDAERSGLWSEYFRIIGELRPKIAVVENVPALLGRGMGRVLGDLASIGYDAEWTVISARQVGSLHLRERIWIIAYPNDGKERIQGFFSQKIPRFGAFSWCQNVRRVEDLRGRPDIPEPLLRGACDGIPSWMDRLAAIGNAIVPQISEWIGRRIVECMA